MRTLVITVLGVLLGVSALYGGDTESGEPPSRFGDPLYGFNPEPGILDLGWSYRLTPLQRAVLNYENSANLLRWDTRLFHPDFVTAGRELLLSPRGMGPGATRVLWMGRPFREPWSGLADLSRLPPAFSGGVSSNHDGAFKGVVGPGCTVDFQPVVASDDLPVTTLYSRDGYYGFAPVEAVHSRRVGRNSRVTLAGFIPSSLGRFPHSRYRGDVVYAALERGLGDGTSLDISYVNGLHKVQIPFSDTTRRARRHDLDLVYNRVTGDDSGVRLGVYSTGVRAKGGGTEQRSGEQGVHFRRQGERFGVYTRFSTLNGETPEGERYRMPDGEGAVVLHTRAGALSWSGLVGFQAWRNGAGLEAVQTATVETPLQGWASLALKRVHQPPSPQQVYGGEAPATVEVPLVHSASLKWRAKALLGSIEVGGFLDLVTRPRVGRIEPDSTTSDVVITGSTTGGWTLDWLLTRGPFRLHAAATGFRRRGEGLEDSLFFQPEPTLRVVWEAGWHVIRFDGYFEGDLALGGRFINRYLAYSEGRMQEMGGAYPMEFRATVRIGRFNIYWGLHNFNAYPYYLVPGLRMMHKEEYWGVNWQLLD